MAESLLPYNLAHRGARKVAPENTLAAFRAAQEMGADGVELDVLCCQTGELVVTHDDDLTIWSNGQGLVTKTPLVALKELDFGLHFSPQFAKEQIPTLQEVIDQLRADMFINIEVKTLSLRPLPEVEAIVQIVERNNLFHRAIISSFNPIVLYHLKRRNSAIARGLLFHFRFPLYTRLYTRRAISTPLLKLQALHPEQRLVTAKFVENAKKRGYLVNTWTVNEVDEMARLIDLGVDAIITDYPDRLRELLLKQRSNQSLLPPIKRKISKIGLQ